MTDAIIIDLATGKEIINSPDEDCILQSHSGSPLYLYAISYKHGDRRFSLEIWAESYEDAEDRVRSMRKSVRLDGQIVAVEEW